MFQVLRFHIRVSFELYEGDRFCEEVDVVNMVIAISMATDEMKPATLPKVVKFHRKVRAGK